MKKISLLALASLFVSPHLHAISLDDIQLWTGTGTNRAAVVVDWNTPEFFNLTTVPAPVTDKTLVWGYRFNGTATAAQMFNAVVAANPRLYAVEYVDPKYGVGIQGIGFNLDGTGIAGVTDGTITDSPNIFTNGVLIDGNLNVDGARSLNSGDLFWSGFDGPYWQLWNELGDSGGFCNSPNRGSSEFWDPDFYTQGQWASAYAGLSGLLLTNGSWIGFSISAAGYPTDTNDPDYDAEMNAFNNDEQAPPSPDGTYVAYVSNTNDFAVQIVSTNNLYPSSPYNNPAAVLNRPTLQFYDPFDGSAVTDRVSVIDDPFNVTPAGADVITEVKTGGQITVKLGRKIYHSPNNPYGIDLIVYGNSFFTGVSDTGGTISDDTDLSMATLTSSGIFGHPAVVSVSQDGTNWYTFPAVSTLFPDNAYRWDDTNSSWTEEEMNPTKPINPLIYTNNFAGETVAGALDQFTGASGGTGFSLGATGLPWIQYVQIQPGPGTYTVIDAIAAVNPSAVGDALSMAPDNLASGITNLSFQNPGDCGQNQVSINFNSLGDIAKISTVGLSDFSSFAPVVGSVSGAYQIQSRSLTGTNRVSFSATLGLRAGSTYAGDGSDLRVYQWCGDHWISQPFAFNAANNQVLVSSVTNFSAFVISQIKPPALNIRAAANSFAFQFAPVANCQHILERSSDLLHWTPVLTNTPDGSQPVSLQDTNPPPGKSFYRVRVNIP